MARRLRTIALVLTLAGCGSEATPTTSPTPSPTPSPTASPTTSPTTSPAPALAPDPPGPALDPSATSSRAPTAPSTSAPPSSPTTTTTVSTSSRRARGPRLSAADRARVEDALREGRRLTRAGQHAEALTQFEAALAIDRGAWRVSCEAGFVAWRAENLEAADRLVRGAMNGMPPGFVPEGERVPRAMCLFNAGLVQEAAAHPLEAREMWEESLRLRDNATVRTRLAALPPAEIERASWQRLPVTASIEEIVAAMRADFAANGLAGLEAGSVGPDEIPLESTRVTGGADALEAHRIHASFHVAWGAQNVEALVVRGAGAQALALLGQSFDAGMAESSTSLEVSPRFEDILPGGAPELVVTTVAGGGSEDCWGGDSHLLVCSVDTASLACVTLQLSSFSACGEDDEGEEEGYCRAPRFAAGTVSFERCAESGDEPAFIEGTHEVRALLGRGELGWPAAWSPLEPVGS